jgi:hypothetical protein
MERRWVVGMDMGDGGVYGGKGMGMGMGMGPRK